MTIDEITQKLVKIGVYMYQTMGFPLEVYNEMVAKMNALEQIGFINGFAERHPKVIDPIFYKNYVRKI